MKVKGTEKAFLTLIGTRGVYKKLGVSTGTVSNWKKYVEQNRISVSKMEEILVRSGSTVISEKEWEVNV